MIPVLCAAAIGFFSMVSAYSEMEQPRKSIHPEDLGPREIDVSGYPEEYQKIYRELFVPVFGFLGGTARAVNSPVIELDPRLEESQRRENPGLFSDARIAHVSRDGWKRRVDEIRRRPPCCGACPVLSLKDAKELWRFLVYDSIARKTGSRAGDWVRHRRELLERFQREHTARSAQWEATSATAAQEGVQ